MDAIRDAIKVVVRIRPTEDKACVVGVSGKREIHLHPSIGLSDEVESISISTPPAPSKRFTFDDVFDVTASQEAVFESIGLPIVRSVVEGFNATILSYGQTGSGKTFTMVGPDGGTDVSISDERDVLGIIPRFLTRLFEEFNSNRFATIEASVSVGVVELYNEALRDLVASSDPLTCGAQSIDLRIREDRSPGGRGVYLEGLTRQKVTSSTDALAVIHRAFTRKSMGSTRMNETSSRSHTIVELGLVQIDRARPDSKTTSQVFLVDLAGSERVGKTGASGDRLKEAQNINLSLTLLGNVISKLTDGKSVHIPYRDAKLTRLLQDSLGGNSLTTLICTCSAEKEHLHETLSTLQFAQRAKAIKNQPIANVVRGIVELNKELICAREEITSLKRRLLLRDRFNLPALEDPMREEIRSLVFEIEELKDELRTVQKERGELADTVNYYKDAESKLRAELEHARVAVAPASMSEAGALQGNSDNPDVSHLNRRSGSSRPRTSQHNRSLLKRVIGETDVHETEVGGVVALTESQVHPSTDVDEVSKSHVLSLTRERALLRQIDQLKEELDTFRKYPILVERELSEKAELKLRHTRELEELKRTHSEELASMNAQREEVRTATSAYPGGEDSGSVNSEREWIRRLEDENKELHAENRLNGMRMSDLAKKIDKLEAENRMLQDDRETMRRDIELHSMEDGKLKQKLLAMLTRSEKDKRQERSYFRKRLLDCFASE